MLILLGPALWRPVTTPFLIEVVDSVSQFQTEF